MPGGQVPGGQVPGQTSARRTSTRPDKLPQDKFPQLSDSIKKGLALVLLALVRSPKQAIMRSGTCPPGTCPVATTFKYVVWQLSSWHLSGQNIYSPTYTCPPIFGMIYLIPTYIFKNCLFSGAQKPSNLHSAPSQEDNGQQARCKDPSRKSARWTSASRTA